MLTYYETRTAGHLSQKKHCKAVSNLFFVIKSQQC